MATIQLPIDGVFDATTGNLIGFAAPSGPELPMSSSNLASLVAVSLP